MFHSSLLLKDSLEKNKQTKRQHLRCQKYLNTNSKAIITSAWLTSYITLDYSLSWSIFNIIFQTDKGSQTGGSIQGMLLMPGYTHGIQSFIARELIHLHSLILRFWDLAHIYQLTKNSRVSEFLSCMPNFSVWCNCQHDQCLLRSTLPCCAGLPGKLCYTESHGSGSRRLVLCMYVSGDNGSS